MCRTDARLGHGVVRLVLLVVRLDVGVRDLHVVGDLVVDPLREELRADVLAQRRLGVALVLEALLELRLAPAEVLLLHLVDLLRDLRVRHLDAELAPPRARTPRAGRGTRPPGSAASGTREVPAFGNARFCAVYDFFARASRSSSVVREIVVPSTTATASAGTSSDATAPGGEHGDGSQCGGGEHERALHRVLFVGDMRLRAGYAVFGKGSDARYTVLRRAQAARRAATIASARASAPSRPSARIATSWRAERVDGRLGDPAQRAELGRRRARPARRSRVRLGRRDSRLRRARARASPPGCGRGSRPARAAARSGPRSRRAARGARPRARTSAIRRWRSILSASAWM